MSSYEPWSTQAEVPLGKHIKKRKKCGLYGVSAIFAQDSGNALNCSEKGRGFYFCRLLWYWANLVFLFFPLSLLMFFYFVLFVRTLLPSFTIYFLAIFKMIVHWTFGRPRAHKNVTIWARVQQQLLQVGGIFKQSSPISCVGLGCSTLSLELSWDSCNYPRKTWS